LAAKCSSRDRICSKMIENRCMNVRCKVFLVLLYCKIPVFGVLFIGLLKITDEILTRAKKRAWSVFL
jgi:hypothetical protein